MHGRRLLLAALLAATVLAPPALAGPVALNDPMYTALGRVFPDPLAGCQVAGQAPCDPGAQGNVAAKSFIGHGEFHDALAFMNQRADFQKYMEVYVLDGKDGPGSATRQEVELNPATMFPGNNLKTLEFTPNPAFQSAGLPTSTLERARHDLIIVRVTDESVPDAGKKRMALALSIHGIERAGAEGGTRAMEDLVTAAAAGRSNDRILPTAGVPNAPTFAEALKKSIVYFTYPNPDGWARGSWGDGGATFQRYNGNGVDPNRDYLDVGFNFRGYSGNSEPETRAFKSFYLELRDNGMPFAAGDDLHGQPHADALSFTLLPHGQHDLAKDTRIKRAAQVINRAQYEATKWSPIIQDNDQPVGGEPVAEGVPSCAPSNTLGTQCKKMYAQTWGTVVDTIDYTTTGTLGDWFDSKVGLNADGIDNEMSFSHIDKQSAFDPHTEQLHVEGNRAIIFAHLSEIIDAKSAEMDPPGAQGYVPNNRIIEEERINQPEAPAGTKPQDPITQTGMVTNPESGSARVIMPFTVQRTDKIFNGGMRVDVTALNFQGISSGMTKLAVQCRHCDDHVGSPDELNTEWVTVADDYNQASIYAQAGVTVAVNNPDAKYTDPTGKEQATEWRAVVTLHNPTVIAAGAPASPPVRMDIEFSSGPATEDGNRSEASGKPPKQHPVNVANTDFLRDLNKYIPAEDERFQEIDPEKVISGAQSLDGLRNLVLADNVFPGATTEERTAWLAKVKQWVESGGNLVLTDAALLQLGAFKSSLTGKAKKADVYVGSVSFCSTSGCGQNTLSDPLNKGIALPASRFNTDIRRQTFEPTPLGFAIQSPTGADFSGARQYQVDAAAFKAAGGRVSATGVSSATDGATAVTTQATMGELKLGAGTIRIAGALLPQPDKTKDHPLGLAPYAVTYTGYILACNLLDAECKAVDAA
jgi:hypothetical protein